MLAQRLMAAKRPAVYPDLVLVFDTSLGDLTVEVPLAGTVNCTVDWGDGSSDSYTTTGTKTHTYATGGVYTVRVSGTLTGFGGFVSRPELRRCLSFGNIGLTSLAAAFYGCANLIELPAELASSVTNINYIVGACTSFNQNIGTWDTSNVTSMVGVFEDATSFNQNIGNWNTANVTNMAAMFNRASAFNQNIGAWDTANVTNMTNMFDGTTVFNQNLSGWCVGHIPDEPGNFATSSALGAGNKPVWGTCPSHVADGSITYIGNATGTDSATLPAHQAGDLILAFAFRDGSTTLPAQPTGVGWIQQDTAAANTCAARIAYKIAAGSSETTGTWTDATTVIFLVYRGVDVRTGFTNLDTESTGSGTTVTYNANGFWRSLSRVVAFAGHTSTNTALGTAPGTLTLIVNPNDATDEAAAFHSTVDDFGNWTSTNVSVGGTGSGWITFTLRLTVPITLAP